MIIASCVLHNITIDNALERQLLENEGLANENILAEENVPVEIVGNISSATKREGIAHNL